MRGHVPPVLTDPGCPSGGTGQTKGPAAGAAAAEKGAQGPNPRPGKWGCWGWVAWEEELEVSFSPGSAISLLCDLKYVT